MDPTTAVTALNRPWWMHNVLSDNIGSNVQCFVNALNNRPPGSFAERAFNAGVPFSDNIEDMRGVHTPIPAHGPYREFKNPHPEFQGWGDTTSPLAVQLGINDIDPIGNLIMSQPRHR